VYLRRSQFYALRQFGSRAEFPAVAVAACLLPQRAQRRARQTDELVAPGTVVLSSHCLILFATVILPPQREQWRVVKQRLYPPQTIPLHHQRYIDRYQTLQAVPTPASG